MDRQFKARLEARFADQLTGPIRQRHDETEMRIGAGDVVSVITALHDESAFRFQFLSDLAGVDTGKVMQVVYHLWSLVHKHSVVLKVIVPRWKDDVVGELPEVPTVSGIWPTADWHEREVYDLSGIRFTGHPNLVRILCPEDWVGHPLRKDYEQPLEYHGIRGK